jgi:hypothetical protein
VTPVIGIYPQLYHDYLLFAKLAHDLVCQGSSLHKNNGKAGAR